MREIKKLEITSEEIEVGKTTYFLPSDLKPDSITDPMVVWWMKIYGWFAAAVMKREQQLKEAYLELDQAEENAKKICDLFGGK